ncbi:methyltransferase domain-containing protein [Nocardiopsis composta]|uniref:23S rRNA (Guanine745-N1)-methyltransferase n=1 Tax=Nocardiopsis composta TaxID=157465 RepID=A0A7W8VGW2_9ACTN|nr:methyltransferase domain-containing protein [Nocardiopsis composta]MBB5436031.1 23S rRNA (guanine745-N1)-methyltransferase [Nocardiopsis composta]
MATTHEGGRPPVLRRLRMPESVLAALACPHCGAGVGPAGNALACDAGHSFDVAKEGYAGLLTGARPVGTADTAEMVRARQEFQEAGHFDPLADRLAEAAAGALGGTGGLVADVGAGTGYYLTRVLDAAPAATGLALDLSKYALRRAAKAHPRSGAVACDAWRGLPLRDGAAALLLNVFAPRDAAEFHRVLRPGGALLVVTPGPGHLGELVAALGMVSVDARKEERLESALSAHFTRDRAEELEYRMLLPHPAADTAAAMGPSAHHLAAEERAARLAALPDPVEVTASFRISLFRPRSPGRGCG